MSESFLERLAAAQTRASELRRDADHEPFNQAADDLAGLAEDVAAIIRSLAQK